VIRSMHFFAHLSVIAHFVMLTYLSVRCAYSVRYALAWTKNHHALESLANFLRGQNTDILLIKCEVHTNKKV